MAMKERRRRKIGISRWSPYGYRFCVVDASGSKHHGYHLPDLKTYRAQAGSDNLRAASVEADPDEQAQIDVLLDLMMEADNRHESLTGSMMLKRLQEKGMDKHYRGRTDKLDRRNLYRNFMSYLDYIQQTQ